MQKKIFKNPIPSHHKNIQQLNISQFLHMAKCFSMGNRGNHFGHFI